MLLFWYVHTKHPLLNSISTNNWTMGGCLSAAYYIEISRWVVMWESDLVIFGDMGWGWCNGSVFPFKIMEYRLLFSENILSNIFSEINWMQKIRSACMCFTSQFHKVGQAFSQDWGSALFCLFSSGSYEII